VEQIELLGFFVLDHWRWTLIQYVMLDLFCSL